MRIAIVTGIFPPDVGGPATYVPLIAAALVERGHQVRVVTTSEPEHLGTPDTHPFGLTRVNRRTPIAVRTLRLVARSAGEGWRPDLLYANGMYLEAALASRLCGRPLVAKVVGDEAWERCRMRGWTHLDFDAFQAAPDGVRARASKHLLTASLKRADRVIVPSRYLKRAVTGWGIEEARCRVIYNAAPPPDDTLPEPAAGRGLRVITVGRLVSWKRVELIVRAIARVPNASLEIVGDGPCRPGLEALVAREGLTPVVRFAGALAPALVPARMRQHDVFVLASSYEGLPHVSLEAIRHGLAVVATPAGGTEEVIEDGRTGCLVGASADEIATALMRLRDEPALRRRLVDGGRAMLAERFTVEEMCRETEITLLAAQRCRLARPDLVPLPDPS